MTRFAWLQARTQTLTVAAALAALAVTAAITGVQLAHLYNSEVLHCRSGCGLAAANFSNSDVFLQRALDVLARAAPALLGLFWGAPLLARELETGSFRLAWTQSVPRSRWLAAKLGLGAATTLAAAGALTLTITWWSRSLDKVGSNQFALFDRRGVVPVGYALFAFAAGALIGVLVRRVVPAMAATLGAFVVARVAIAVGVRPHLLAPLHKTVSLANADGLGFMASNGGPISLVARGSAGPDSWTLSSQILTTAGRPASSGQLSAFLHQYCPAIAAPPPITPDIGHPVAAGPADALAFHRCIQAAAAHFRLLVTYQPGDRYWTFQWLETGIFVALAVAAAALCYWWVARRVR